MKRPAFTLIEIIICLGLISVFSLLIISSTRSLWGTWGLKAASRSVATQLHYLQSQAISQHETTHFHSEISQLPFGILFAKTSAITFSSSGQTPPGGSGTIILANHFGQTKKVIVSTAGRIRIE